MYTLVLVWLGKTILLGSRLRGGAGSALPGLVIEKLSPSFIANMAKQLKYGTVLITGTNGKTTTTKMVGDILRANKKKVIFNRSGSNMSRGIASTFIEKSNLLGNIKEDIGLFEVDEAFIPDVSEKLQPKAIAVLNLLRDQLDRYGELDRTAELINEGLQNTGIAVLNWDDRLVNTLGKTAPAARIYFGAAEYLRRELPDDAGMYSQHTKTSAANGAGKLNVLLQKAVEEKEYQVLTFSMQRKQYNVQLPIAGLYNAYNAAAALAIATALKLNLEKSASALAHSSPAFGRSEIVQVEGKKVQLLLVKNPAGYNQVIRTFLDSEKNLPLLLALNDNFADGRDVSWIWDVNFELMQKQKHHIMVTGLRAYDLALRLKYAQIDSIVEQPADKALEQFIHSLPSGQIGYIVPTYTAMLHLRASLGKRAKVAEFWQ